MLLQTLFAVATTTVASAISINRRAAITDFDSSPIGFSWPPGRTFNSSTATKAPCGGSPAGVRSSYPLSGGDISLTSKTLLDSVNILWTNETDPTRFHAFSTYTNTLSELGAGHYCQAAPDFASFGLKAGDDVTLMIMYNLQDVADNYYYCADINLVQTDGFTPSEQYMCSNYTSSLQEASEEDSMKVGSTSTISSADATSNQGSQTSSAQPAVSDSDSAISAAAGGGIGAAVTIAVVTLVAALAYFFGYVRFGKRKPVVLGDHASDSTGVPIKAAQF
ncbi:hypothetical protein I302_104656 [Kwoniella bestiolae CBS 10118]|uniref:Copper acquisition factor BIM1-like domain-containing protein n=1 Tax=Kwoniella bestiolae CBS 10118 TaxID=1296100 RepID=A0A1B9GBW0_9TREE|nr:hypothetical protein I302_03366 [Kwoniella bestiolae CBS 10118]OCF28507.1 hypothetical protein I302_03366 [Kwoniella bestiolae CBS 10118]